MNQHDNNCEKRWISLYEVLKKQKYFDDPGNSDISEYIEMLTHSVPGYSVDEEGKYAEGIDLPAFHEQLRSEENLKLVRKEGSRAKFCDELKKVFFDLRDVRDFQKDFHIDHFYWANMAFWTATEAACLLSSIDPKEMGRYPDDHDEEVIDELKTWLIRAGAAGAIKTVTKEGGLDPKSVIEWTERKFGEVPYKLRKAMGLKSASWESSIDHVEKDGKIPCDQESAESPLHGLSFFRNRGIWNIGEVGQEIHFSHLDGLSYIHFLLQYEHKGFNPLEVYHLGEVPPELKDEQKISFQPKHDRISKIDYRKALKLLEEQYSQEQNLEKREDILEKINHLSKQLQEEGRGFQSNNSEKARQNVSKAISAALMKIKKDCPRIYKTLSPGITTGNSFRYSPSKSIPWKLSPNK